MRIQNSKRMRISECVLYTHYMRIQDTFIDPNSAISRYAFQMHFRCASMMLKSFDAKLETFQMRFVFTGYKVDIRIKRTNYLARHRQVFICTFSSFCNPAIRNNRWSKCKISMINHNDVTAQPHNLTTSKSPTLITKDFGLLNFGNSNFGH